MMRNQNNATLDARRRTTRGIRISPDDLVRRRLIILSEGRQVWDPPPMDPAKVPVPAEIWIRLSERSENRAGPTVQSADWDFARWLEDAQASWSDRKMDLYFVSFGQAFMKPVFFEQLRALADRNLRWQTRFLTDGRSLASIAVIDQMLRSSLEELHIYVTGLGGSTVDTRALSVMKDLVDLRQARGQNHPNIICRLCPNPTSGPRLIAELSQWVKQAGIDRLEVIDKETEEKRLWGLPMEPSS